MEMKSGTPYVERQVVALGGNRYKLLTTDEAREVSGRRWNVEYVSAQDAEPEEMPIPISTFHEGSGFTYAEIPGTYDYATGRDGWDPMSPGKLSTWPRKATGTFTNHEGANFKGWIIDAGDGYMYILKGRFASKFTVGTWTKPVADFAFGASDAAIVSGRPARFKGKWYVPIVDSTGAQQRFYQLTPGGAGADTWTLGPSGVSARCFTTWRDLLVRGSLNNVYTVAADPMVNADWSAPSAVATTDTWITDLLPYDRYLLVRNTRGLWSFDEDLTANNELPDLESVESSVSLPWEFGTTVPGVGMATSNAFQIVPHDAGLVRWAPGGWETVGPEQERMLEGDKSLGWGPVAEIVPYGQWFFAAHNTRTSPTNAIVGGILTYGPGRGARGPVVPYSVQSYEEGSLGSWIEALAIVQPANRQAKYLVGLGVRDTGSGLTYEPIVYELPLAGLTPAGDPAIDKKVSVGAIFFTSRYYQPARAVQKTYRTFEFWLEETTAGTGPGFQVWASVNDGTFFQLLDATGAAAELRTTGFKRLFFPKTSAAVGNYVQLKFVVPAISGGEVAAQYVYRDGVLRCHLRPLTTPQVEAAFLIDALPFEDGQRDRRSIQQQITDLEDLFAPNAAPVAYSGPNGESGYLVPKRLRLQEVTFKGASVPVRVATVQMEVASYA